jgi:hypothetical protein
MNATPQWEEMWKRFTLPNVQPDEVYEVSNYGKVRHFNKETNTYVIIKSFNQFKEGNGFEYVSNFKRVKGTKKRTSESVHRLVAMKFCEKVSEQHKIVIHKDYNKKNNRAENLQWVTQHEMYLHNNNNPKVKKARKNRTGKISHSKLTETDVIRLKIKLARSNNPLYKIAKEFGITHTQLNRIRKGENWAHVKVDDLK